MSRSPKIARARLEIRPGQGRAGRMQRRQPGDRPAAARHFNRFAPLDPRHHPFQILLQLAHGYGRPSHVRYFVRQLASPSTSGRCQDRSGAPSGHFFEG
jgi:hypothetical protein